jgi:hypothetical protein
MEKQNYNRMLFPTRTGLMAIFTIGSGAENRMTTAMRASIGRKWMYIPGI